MDLNNLSKATGMVWGSTPNDFIEFHKQYKMTIFLGKLCAMVNAWKFGNTEEWWVITCKT